MIDDEPHQADDLHQIPDFQVFDPLGP